MIFQELAEKAEAIQMKLKMASAPSLSAPHSPIQGTSKPVKQKTPTELPKVNEQLRRSPRKPIPKLIVPKKFLEDVAFRSPSPKKQRKPRTESETSTVSPCSREVRDLVRNSFRPNINCRTRYEQVVFLSSYQLFTVMFMSNGSSHDLLQMATTSQSPSENQPETGGSSTSPGCNTSAGISQILRGKLIQGAVISPSSGIIRTPTSSPSAHLRSSYVS